MKGILIDVTSQTVTNVTFNEKDTLNEWYNFVAVNSRMVEVAMELPNEDGITGNSIMVDEEGLLYLTTDSKFFTYKGAHQPFAGNGLIVGINYENGETIDVSITADDVKNNITFHNIHEVRNFM